MLKTFLSSLPLLKRLPPKQSVKERLRAFPPAGAAPVAADTRIYWDSHQVPYVQAANDEDAAFALGTVHAHLRLAQLEMLRRVSQGTTAEVLGESAVAFDHTLRTIGFGRAAAAIITEFPADTRLWLERFVEGINWYQQRGTQAPHELEVLGVPRVEWQLMDVVTIARFIAADVNWLIWFQLLPLTSQPSFPRVWSRILEQGARSVPSFGARSELLSLLAEHMRSGSNAFAVSGSRSASGAGLLASDPHLGFQFPNPWLLAGLDTPSLRVVGMMIPGLPFFAIGRNRDIAWGGTNMWAVSSSLYDASALAPGESTTREETIRVRRGANRTVAIRETSLGPVVTDAPMLGRNYSGPPLALKWIGHAPSDEFTAFLRVNRASNWEEFRSAFSSYAVSGQNMVYADRQGHIGQLLAARFAPAASAVDSSFILDPSNPAAAWGRVYRSMELPAAFDPPSGILASSNNAPVLLAPAIGRFHPSNDRQERILELLGSAEPAKISDLQRVQQDVFIATAAVLKHKMLEYVSEPTPSGLRRIVATLRDWDGTFAPDAVGPSVYAAAVHALAKRWYEELYGEGVAGFVMRSASLQSFLLEELGRAAPEEARRRVEAAFTEIAGRKDIFKPWGDLHRIALKHPLGGLPIVGRRFRFGDIPAGGGQMSVMKTAHRFVPGRHYSPYGAVARFCTDLSSPQENYFVLLGGQDGYLNSDNFLDQVEPWRRGEYLRLPLDPDEARTKACSETVLTRG